MDCPQHIRWRGARTVVQTGGCLYVALPRKAIRKIPSIDCSDLESGCSVMSEITDNGEFRISLSSTDTDADAGELEADTDADSRPVVESEIEADGSKVVSADGMVETQENELHGAKREQPTCSECGRAINDTDAAVNIGGALGQNIWVHHQCPQDTEEGGAS